MLWLQALGLVLDKWAAEEVLWFNEIQEIVEEERCCAGVRRCSVCRKASTRLEVASWCWSDLFDLRRTLQAAVTVQGDSGGTWCSREELDLRGDLREILGRNLF